MTHHERLAFSMREAAELLGVSRPQVYRLRKAGQLKTVTVGGTLRVPRWALDQLLDRDHVADAK
jgi:excisionase family DNA binding protein